MADNSIDEALQRMLDLEGEMIDGFAEVKFDELLSIYNDITEEILGDTKYISDVLRRAGEVGKEVVYSNFRVLKALLAEIEYRVRENLN